MDTYRIKEKYKHLVSEKTRDSETFVKCNTGYKYRENSLVSDYSDEMFEKVEERIEVMFHQPEGGALVLSINQGDNIINPTEQQRILCEKVLNGDMVEKEVVGVEEREIVKKQRRLAEIFEENVEKENHPIVVKDGDDWFRVREQRAAIEKSISDNHKLLEKAKEVMIEDGNTSYVLKNSNEMEDLWSKVLNNELHTKDQMIEMVNEWIGEPDTKCKQTNSEIKDERKSFKEFINSK